MSGDHERSTDRWLKWAVVVAPLITYILGLASGTVMAYQAFKNDSTRITLVEGWKDKQEDFNKVVIAQIATLNQVLKTKI